MPRELSAEEQRAVEAAAEVPARVPVPGADLFAVLLPVEDYDWARQLLGDLPEVPRATHPRTGQVYAIVPSPCYERFRAFFEEDPITPGERQRLLQDFGRRAGWDDPDMDVYNEIQPGRLRVRTRQPD